MPAGESPIVARRRVRLALRAARKAKGLTQGQVAEAMEWSLSKVMRIEGGEVSVSATDLRALLTYLDISDPGQVDQLIEAARVSRRKRWSDDPRFREHLTESSLQFFQFEAEAVALRYFNLVLIPGLLQTSGYAEAIFRSYRDDLSPESIQVRIEARLRRRQLLTRPDPPHLLVILDESVLYREVGGPKVMAEQLRELARLMDLPNVLVRVLPFAAAAPLAVLGPFCVLDLSEEQDAILYRETHLDDNIAFDRRRISYHRDLFEQLWPRAFDDDASKQMISQRATHLEAADPTPAPG